MSYILEALRRADAERERDAVPTLQAQPGNFDLSQVEPALQPKPWLWLLGGGVVAAVVPLVVFLSMRGTPRPAAPAAPSTADVRPLVPAPMPITPAPASSAPAPSLAAPSSVEPRKAVTSAPPAQPPASRRSADTKKAPPTSAPSPAPAMAGGKTKPDEPAPPLPSAAELPAEVRQGMPQVTVSGNMYSDRPENRMVVINGQLLRENDPVAPDLVLEEIRRNSVVLRYRGQRYVVPH